MREAFANEYAGAERVPLVDVETTSPLPTVERHPELLGELAVVNAKFLASNGWRELVVNKRGRSAINPAVGSVPHDAAVHLDYLQKFGAPAHSTVRPKTPEELQAAADRGPHPSATAHREFLWEEAYEMCQQRHTMVLPLSAVKDIGGVQFSPPMVLPQRDRRPRTLCDLTYSGVNEVTVPLAPKEAMQFGQVLRRILIQIHRADPRWGPVCIAKDDISDGFYNVFVNANGVKQFGIILPTPPGQEPLVLFFLVLPMGWVLSPPVFCALTETVADLTKAGIDSNWRPPLHRLEQVADTLTPSDRPVSKAGRPPRIQARNKGPLGVDDVYMDDFILLAQGTKKGCRRLRRVLFHMVDRVFRPPDDDDDAWKKDPNSIKKLLRGDGSLETVKVVLGWVIDTIAGTIELPPHGLERLMELLAAFPQSRQTCPKRELHRLLGELRSMIIAIPGGVGCLSWLQEHIKESGERIRLNAHFHDAIDNFWWLAHDIGSGPARIAEVVPEAPLYIGGPTRQGQVWAACGCLTPTRYTWRQCKTTHCRRPCTQSRAQRWPPW